MKFYKKTDIMIIIGILLISLTAWFVYHSLVSGQKVKAEIYFRSQLVKTVDLSAGRDETFSIPQNENVVFHLYPDGTIAFVESDCPDKVCIHTGKIGTAGQFAACLPNEIVVKIVPADSGEEPEIDMVIGK